MTPSELSASTAMGMEVVQRYDKERMPRDGLQRSTYSDNHSTRAKAVVKALIVDGPDVICRDERS